MARELQAEGLRVIVLHGIVPKDGLCTCADRTKPNHERTAGKHPVDKDWQNAPQLTEEQMQAAWPETGWRAVFNIGVATGRDSDLLVLDIDPDNGGTESILKLQGQHAPLETNWAQRTGSGGYHLGWAMPEGFEPTNRRGGLKDYPGLDIRGQGGQIVVAPSRSAKGDYAWLKRGARDQAPAWFLDLLRPAPPAPPPAPAAAPAGPVPEGDAEDQRLNGYAATVLAREVQRLDAMREAATPRGEGYRGQPWDDTVFSVSANLLELANSEWSGLALESAYAHVLAHAPTDEGFTSEDVNKKWQQAVSTVGDRGRPYPVARQDTAAIVATWAAEDGVRVDPALSAPPPPPPPAVLMPMRSWDDIGSGERMVDHFGGELRYVTDAESWACYRNGLWELVPASVVRTFVHRLTDLLPLTEALAYSDEPDDDAKESLRARFLKYNKAQRMSARISGILTEAKSRPELASKRADFDQHPMLLNVANGVVDLRTGVLAPHDSRLMLMQQSPVAYNPLAPCPLWQRFLDRVQPDQEMQLYLQRVLGYSITGCTAEQAFFIHHGEGANGKSVVNALVSLILGSYAKTVSPSTLMESQTEQHPAGIAAMEGRRWLPASETAPGRRLDEEKVKNFTGSEPVSARALYQDWRDFTPTGKLHLITNHLPRLTDAKSIWRRIHVIVWAVSIPEREQDRGLETKLRAEAEGILAWLVRGAQAWGERGLDAPASARLEVEMYREDSDTFGDFLRERTLPATADVVTPVKALYQAYQAWAFEQGLRRPMVVQSFSAAMCERGYERHRSSRARGFCGVVPVAAQVELPWSS